MAEAEEILCSRCGTPFPKDKGKTVVTCLVCGQLRPDLDMVLEDDDDAEDLGAALSTSAGGGGMGPAAATAAEPESHVLRVSGAEQTGGGIDSPPPLPRRQGFRVDQPYMAMDTMGVQPMMAMPRRGAAPGDRLLDRIGPVLLIICPLAAGMAGGLNMLSRTEDFSPGTWCAVGVVFAAMVAAALVAGLVGSGVLYLVRLRWKFLLRLVFLAAAGAVCYYGVHELPSHLQVRHDGLPGFVMRQ